MKVGVLIEFTSNTDIDAKFAELKEMGVDSCQLVCWDRPTLQDDAMAEAINKGLEKYGIHATAFWCGWEGRRVWDFYEGQLTLGLIPSDYRVERLKMLMEGSDIAKKIHVTDLATHVGYMPENPYDPKYEEVLVACKAIVEKCKENGQNFLFETGQETPVTLKRAIQDIEKAVGKGNVGINLDPANLIMYGKANPVDALEVFGEYVMGIHGKDGKYPTDGHHLGDEVPLGQGKVNYSAFIAKLKEIETMESDGTFDVLPKKEVIQLKKEWEKLEKNLGGIKNMTRVPDAIFVVDPKKERICVQEAHALGITLIGIGDTNCDPEELDYIIPGNDDAIRAVKLIVSKMADAVIEAKQGEAVYSDADVATEAEDIEEVAADAE